MAEKFENFVCNEKKMNKEEEDHLLKKNRELICLLKFNVKELKEKINCSSNASHSRKFQNTSTPKYLTNKNKTPIKSYSKNILSQRYGKNENVADTYCDALNDQGNLRKTFCGIRPSQKFRDKHPKKITKNKKKSILCSPQSCTSKYNFDYSNTKKVSKKRVCFSPTTHHQYEKSSESEMDISMMGYDWIAHMVDNTSAIDQPDTFFDEIAIFRQENLPECNSLSNTKDIVKSPEKQVGLNLPKMELNHQPLESESDVPLCCTGEGAYSIDNRCNLVPIHGPYSKCPVCKKRPTNNSIIKNDDKYIRVSIPRSTLQSPYRIKPHRRKSFDNSDSVALATHCLAGWQNSKPVYAPGPTNIDLVSDSNKTKFTTLKSKKSFPR